MRTKQHSSRTTGTGGGGERAAAAVRAGQSRRRTHGIRHEHSAVVDATPERAWRLASDIRRYPEWVGVTLAVLDPCPEAVEGAVYRERTRLAGPVTTLASWTVVARDDAALFQRHECADDGGPVRSLWIELRVDEDVQTRFTVTIGCEISAGPVTALLGRLLSRRFEGENERNVARFAALLAAERDGTRP